MRGLDLFGSVQISDGAADFQDAAVGARAEPEFVDGRLEQLLRRVIHGAVALDVFGAHLGVGVNLPIDKTLQLDGAGGIHPLSYLTRTFSGIFVGELLITQSRHFDLNIDPIKQRAGNLGPVALDLQWRAGAFLLRIGEKSTGAFLRYLSAIWF